MLLGLGGLLRAVALGADGPPQEESYALTAPRPRSPQQPKQLNAGMFQAEINSFALCGRSKSTRLNSSHLRRSRMPSSA